jgi:hypothetical protein
MRAPGCRLTLTLSPPPPLLTTVAPWHGPSLRGGDPFDSLRSLRVTWGAKRRTRAGAIGHGLRLRCRTWTRTRLHPGATTPSSPHSGQDAHCTMEKPGHQAGCLLLQGKEMVAWASGPCRGGLTVGRMPTAPLGGRQSHQCQQHTVGDGFTPSRATAAATMKRIGSTHRLTPTLRERRQLRSLWLPSIQERSGPRPARWPGSRTVAGNRDRCGPRAAG